MDNQRMVVRALPSDGPILRWLGIVQSDRRYTHTILLSNEQAS